MISLHNAELEAHVLVSIIEYNQTFDKYHTELNRDLFFFAQNQIIFDAVNRIKLENPLQELDWVLVRNELQRTDQLDGIGGIGGEEYLQKIMQVMARSNLDTAIESLSEYAALRTIEEASQAAITQTLSGLPAADIANQLAEKINGQAGASTIPHYVPMDYLSGIVEKIKSYEKQGSPFIDVGFTELSFKMGLSPANLLVIAARPSMGKTALGMNVLTAIAKNNPDKTALFFSLEMGAEDIFNRLVAAETGVSLAAIRGGQAMTGNDWKSISDNLVRVRDLPMVLIDKPSLTISQVRTECQRVKRQGKKPLSVIMVDYLQIMGGLDGNDKISRIGEATRQLKALGKEYNCPVIVLSQLNRSLEMRGDKRPINSDLRDSGTIEQDADIIAMIYRDEVYHDQDLLEPAQKEKVKSNKGCAEIIITKNRNGAIGTVQMGFEGQYSRFTDTPPSMESYQ